MTSWAEVKELVTGVCRFQKKCDEENERKCHDPTDFGRCGTYKNRVYGPVVREDSA